MHGSICTYGMTVIVDQIGRRGTPNSLRKLAKLALMVSITCKVLHSNLLEIIQANITSNIT